MRLLLIGALISSGALGVAALLFGGQLCPSRKEIANEERRAA
ncbi:hypothetical protein [Deinococcus gobiensis]|uniref:Uncharacterized protein n=1 Tax=Deinococcus gobiensis (strain DSM 21396 / JCM 16679 / CGMCC 1.7299 / I-0) TaxID=745776 RepID=H8H3V9_DEIGI|nr:hypothetical protein [Deinococcus gobiensis]AFD28206.1 hypothetical protein DGo_PE0062 [Deinococcus gobiensis I-0]